MKFWKWLLGVKAPPPTLRQGITSALRNEPPQGKVNLGDGDGFEMAIVGESYYANASPVTALTIWLVRRSVGLA